MANCIRMSQRETVNFDVLVQWQDEGELFSAEFRARDVSEGGLQIAGANRIETAKQVRIEVPQYDFPLEAVVRYCASDGSALSIGLEFCSETRLWMRASKKDMDRYAVPQLGVRADRDTVQRAFRIDHSLLGQISSSLSEHATNLQRRDLERLRRWAALGEFQQVLADLKDRIAHKAVADPGRLVVSCL